MTAHPAGTALTLERWQDVDQEVAAGSHRVEHVAEDGGQVETADSLSREVGAGDGGAAGAQDKGDVIAAEQSGSCHNAASLGQIGTAASVDGGGEVAVAGFGKGPAVGADGGGEVKDALFGIGAAVGADGGSGVKVAVGGVGDALGAEGGGGVEAAVVGKGLAAGADGECGVKDAAGGVGVGVAIGAQGDREVAGTRHGERGALLQQREPIDRDGYIRIQWRDRVGRSPPRRGGQRRPNTQPDRQPAEPTETTSVFHGSSFPRPHRVGCGSCHQRRPLQAFSVDPGLTQCKKKLAKTCNFALRTGSVWYGPAGKPVGSPRRKAFFGTVSVPRLARRRPNPV